MELIVKESQLEIGISIAKEMVKKIKKNPHTILGLATGSSPLAVYRELINQYQKGQVSFKDVITFNLDEYLGEIPEEKSYRFFMYNEFFKHVDINLENTHFPSQSSLDQYDQIIKNAGGIDIQLLGIGQNGHIAFNEPGTSFESKTHIVTLDEKTRIDNSRFFESLEKVPTQAITMGLDTIMNAKEIIMIVLGDNKVQTLKALFGKEKDEDFPASILSTHPNVKVYTTLDLFKKAFY